MQNLNAQNKPFIGLWEVEKVSMGDQSMTPIAKWAKYNTDGTYESGNGWLKSYDGTWSYDAEKNYLESIDLLGIKDELGGFTISFEGKKMIWKRMEFGNEVTVLLKPITKLPMAPADYLTGVWVSNNKEGLVQKIHFRWDRIVISYDEKNQKDSGYWHIHGHKPEITILPHSENNNVESWRIEVNETTLKMIGLSDTNKGVTKAYTRTNKL